MCFGVGNEFEFFKFGCLCKSYLLWEVVIDHFVVVN
jgi:hypothetical protein